MLKKIQERIFPFLIAFSALSVSASAAFYSVSGLSKLFAGASFEVIIMASSLEIAKLVIASLLYQFRKTLPRLLKFYLTTACAILIVITSMGIYGFLSAAYQETANKSGIVDKYVSAEQSKLIGYQQQLSNIESQQKTYDDNISKANENILTLSEGFGNNVVQYTDANGNVITTQSSSTRRALQEQINQQTTYRDGLVNKREELTPKYNEVNDSINNIEIRILQLETNTDVAAELGPLKYLSGLTGIAMDKIINYLLLIIIFVFDPLAIALVVAANYAFEQLKKNYKTNLYGEKVKVKDNPPRGLTEDVIEESKAKRVEAPTQTSSSFSEEQIQWER